MARKGTRLDEGVRPAHPGRRLDRDADAGGEPLVVELSEHVDRQRADALEVEVDVVLRQVELLEVRAHSLCRKARVAQGRDRRALCALRQLLPVRAHDEPVVDDVRRLRSERAVERRVQLLVRAMVRAADHMCDPEVGVVDDAREMERGRPVVAPHHHALEALGQPGPARRFEVTLCPRALAHRPLLPLDAEPPHVLDDRLLPTRHVARRIRVVDAKQQPVAEAAVRDRAQRIPDVERSRRARREADADHAATVTGTDVRAGMKRASTAPITAIAALTQNAAMNADSAGTCVPEIVSALMMAAPTCPPITWPIVRSTVFMPVATPVSVGRTASTISFAIAANANGTPTPISTIQAEISPGWSWRRASRAMPAAVRSSPSTSGSREP